MENIVEVQMKKKPIIMQEPFLDLLLVIQKMVLVLYLSVVVLLTLLILLKLSR
jgi:hypothetical protein